MRGSGSGKRGRLFGNDADLTLMTTNPDELVASLADYAAKQLTGLDMRFSVGDGIGVRVEYKPGDPRPKPIDFRLNPTEQLP